MNLLGECPSHAHDVRQKVGKSGALSSGLLVPFNPFLFWAIGAILQIDHLEGCHGGRLQKSTTRHTLRGAIIRNACVHGPSDKRDVSEPSPAHGSRAICSGQGTLNFPAVQNIIILSPSSTHEWAYAQKGHRHKTWTTLHGRNAEGNGPLAPPSCTPSCHAGSQDKLKINTHSQQKQLNAEPLERPRKKRVPLKWELCVRSKRNPHCQH